MSRVNAAGKFQLFITFLPQYNAYIRKNRRKTNFGNKKRTPRLLFREVRSVLKYYVFSVQ